MLYHFPIKKVIHLARTLHELAIEIQGDIDSRFGDSIKDMTDQLKQLDDGVKSIADSNIKPDGTSRYEIRSVIYVSGRIFQTPAAEFCT